MLRSRAAQGSRLVRRLHNFPEWKQNDYFHFEVTHRSSKSAARVGRIHTPHGVIDTPMYVPVGTNASVKFVDVRQADEAGMQLMFCNTYHLMVHPGADVVRDAGGLHRFMGRERGPLITDSGGFQLFSLNHQGETLMAGKGGADAAPPGAVPEAGSRAIPVPMPAGCVPGSVPTLKRSRPRNNQGSNQNMVHVQDDGVDIRSYRDGSLIRLSPETSVDAQKALGADIIIPLDELPGPGVSDEELVLSLTRTHAWEARSLQRHLESPQQQVMYGVLHGGLDRKLRQASVDYLCQLPFDGWALGGNLGRDRDDLHALLRDVMPMLPPDERPVHLLGIADDKSIPNSRETIKISAEAKLRIIQKGDFYDSGIEKKRKRDPG